MHVESDHELVFMKFSLQFNDSRYKTQIRLAAQRPTLRKSSKIRLPLAQKASV